MGTDIRFINYLPEQSFTMFTSAAGITTDKIPPAEFSWVVPLESDPVDIEKKKNLIHPVFNQYLCGSCWAVSVSTTMSDCLVVSSVVDFTPYISTTYFLSAYPQHQCGGGNSAELVKSIEGEGAVDITCIDYSWCINNENCHTRSSQDHFGVNDLSTKIPDPGCYFESNKYVYYIDKDSSRVVSLNRSTPVKTLRSIVKTHIYNYGPAVGGYLILSNFLNGKFTEVNGGIYFERADYDDIRSDGSLRFTSQMTLSENNRGGHAVSIVGWGIAKHIQYNNGKWGDVPYWHCRNSWGTEWGDNGYFKIAMYPFNKRVQFEDLILANIDNEIYRFGGIILFKTTKRPKVYNIPAISDNHKSNISPIYDSTFYKTNVSPGNIRPKKPYIKSFKLKPYNFNQKWIIILLIIGIGIYYLHTRI